MQPHRHDEAERIAGLEDNAARVDELPVHREGKRQPIGLDNGLQRMDLAHGPIRGATNQQANPGIGAEQVARVERQHPMAEMRGGELAVAPRGAVDRHAQIRQPGTAIPLRGHVGRQDKLPSETIGDRERQAAIGETLIGGIHPGALGASRTQLHGGLAHPIAFHPPQR